jgi:sulfatase maturation enzyme AslB (radical SAM superfamily)
MNEQLQTISALIRKNIANAVYLASLKKPEVFGRYLVKFLKAKLLHQITPRQIDIALTFDCNLTCDHCFTAPLYNHEETEMDWVTLKKVARE